MYYCCIEKWKNIGLLKKIVPMVIKLANPLFNLFNQFIFENNILQRKDFSQERHSCHILKKNQFFSKIK